MKIKIKLYIKNNFPVLPSKSILQNKMNSRNAFVRRRLQNKIKIILKIIGKINYKNKSNQIFHQNQVVSQIYIENQDFIFQK